MNHTARTLSALTIWTVSMAIFFLSNPTRVRAFTMTPLNTLSTSRSVTRLNYFQHQVIASTDLLDTSNYESKRVLQKRQRKWIEQSTHYYTTIMKNEKRRTKGQLKNQHLRQHKKNFQIAKKLYFARNKIHNGDLSHAEVIYRRLIHELSSEEQDCDHAQLATSTLLLALLLQRCNRYDETRKMFDDFFHMVHKEEGDVFECVCCAKVIQAYALFEMKQGNKKKSFRLASMAVKMDEDLHSVFRWKQFREAQQLVENNQERTLSKES
ncbi:hypothetical protein CTEN210_01103 [Chaetoceros tenuissimus]|uniref:Uncharacterized protein n=1 Tax=Chaetoceros tenuissimus TaxID=426638 RepID=A0AAD3GZS1_9STRA|nr:hypothetical protein CTEN210_01103 [Chaetoceros tenuissimus]